MTEILQLGRQLLTKPDLEPVEGVTLRTFGGREDIARWLEIRHRAFARLRVGVRQWDEPDFRREFLEKPWWQPEHLWFAESASNVEPVGTVTLALRGQQPVVHWLAVLPAWRHRGVGAFLMSVLEARAWELGYRQLWLETHAAWESAVRLYKGRGYVPVVGSSSSPANLMGGNSTG